MAETQILAVKRQAPNRVGLASIDLIADDGMSVLGEMNADLMLTPRFQPDLNQRGFQFPAHNMDVRNRELPHSCFSG